MKIGNIKEVVAKYARKFKEFTISNKDYPETISMEYEIKGLPKKNLEKWFQERYNKSLDYDQWAGIRDELERMGRILYEKTLTIIGDSILEIQAENQEKIEDLERQVIEKCGDIDSLKKELKKYKD